MIQKISASPAFTGKVIVGKDREDREKMARSFSKMSGRERSKVEAEIENFKQIVEAGTDDDMNILLEVRYLENGTQRNPDTPRIHARISQTYPGERKYDRPILAQDGATTGRNSNEAIAKVFNTLSRAAIIYANSNSLDINA